jgi:hypothetical protein
MFLNKFGIKVTTRPLQTLMYPLRRRIRVTLIGQVRFVVGWVFTYVGKENKQ